MTLSTATPWVAAGVAATVVIVILAVFVTSGGGSGGAQFGDHWHADLNISTCGGSYTMPEPSPLPGLHTHGDSQIHIEPRRPSEAGNNASLGTFFENNGIRVEDDLIQIPGEPAFRNGDNCPDGESGSLRVVVNGDEVVDFLNYLPKDGDRVVVTFD